MHRLTWIVALLLLASIGAACLALATLASEDIPQAERYSAAFTFGVTFVVCVAQACVLGTLVAIERKVDRLAKTNSESEPLELKPQERKAIRSSLPPRADGRL